MPTPAPAHPPRHDPDIRFLLANERTLLAWLRTGLGLQAGGAVLLHATEPSAAGIALALVLLAAGVFCHVSGWVRWREADRAIRADELPGRGLLPDLVVLLLVVLSVAAAAVLLAVS